MSRSGTYRYVEPRLEVAQQECSHKKEDTAEDKFGASGLQLAVFSDKGNLSSEEVLRS